jgi:glucose dehydrogenase
VPGLEPTWVFATNSAGDATSLQSTPVVSGGCAFIGSTGRIAYAIDSASGAAVWRTQLEAYRLQG